MAEALGHRDCVVMFTHQWNPSLARHYQRLQREAGTVLPVFLVAHAEGKPPAGAPADLVVSSTDAGREWPARHAAWLRAGGRLPSAHVDIIFLTALRHPRFAEFDRIWFLEYDLDFSGNWSRLFREAAAYDADLLVSHLRSRNEEPRWSHMPSIVDPEDDPASQIFGMFCIARISRRLIDHWHSELSAPGWDGHFELVLPTIARRGGFRVEDLGGSGSFTPPERRNRHYEGSFVGLHRGFYTYAFRPPRLWHYYADSRLGFWQRNRIYHPIKLDGTPRQRFRSRVMIFRDRIRAFFARCVGREPVPRALRKK